MDATWISFTTPLNFLVCHKQKGKDRNTRHWRELIPTWYVCVESTSRWGGGNPRLAIQEREAQRHYGRIKPSRRSPAHALLVRRNGRWRTKIVQIVRWSAPSESVSNNVGRCNKVLILPVNKKKMHLTYCTHTRRVILNDTTLKGVSFLFFYFKWFEYINETNF